MPYNRNGPPPIAGRSRNSVATTATVTVTRIARVTDIPQGGHTYRLDDLPERIRAHVTIDPESGCWVSSRNIDRGGYSRLQGEGVHRIAWRELVGPIPDGLVLDHVKARGCRWNACCWPAHLEPVTNRENILRGRSFAAVNAAKVECDHGHAYDERNTYTPPEGTGTAGRAAAVGSPGTGAGSGTPPS